MNKNTKIKVAVLMDALPYATCKPHFTGIAVDIWEKVAQKYKLDFEYIGIARNYDKAVEDLYNDKYDVALADFSVIHRRYNLVLFTRPFYISKIKIYRKPTGNYFYNLFTNIDLQVIFGLCFSLILFYSVLFKYYTHNTFSNSFYEVFLTFFANMKEVFPNNIRNFNNSYMKILNAIWSILRYVFYTIVITQFINVFIKTSVNITPEEIETVKEINIIQGASFVDYVKKIGKDPIENKSTDEILNKIYESSERVYWVEDANTVTEKEKEKKYNIELCSSINPVAYDEITIAVNNKRKDILDKIDDVIIELQDNGDMIKICKGYLNDEAALNGCAI